MELRPSPLAVAIKKLFGRLESEYSTNQRPTFIDSDLLELHGIFGETLKLALDIVDRDRVKICRNGSGTREIIEIPGHRSIIYKLYPNINYCSCDVFLKKVLLQQQYTCKHVLAAKLALILRKITEEIVDDVTFNYLTEIMIQ